MFRKMRRWKQEITKEECIEVLEKEPRGVLSVHGEDGYPYGFPMDFIYLNGKVYFHCAKAGHKIDAIEKNDKVSFCVMDKGFKKEGGWALNIKSVILFGTIRKINDEKEHVDILRQLGLKYYPAEENVDEEIKRSISRVQMLEMSIDHMTGKLVNER